MLVYGVWVGEGVSECIVMTLDWKSHELWKS